MQNLNVEQNFQAGDRVKTISECTGTVVRVDQDEIGLFIVVLLDIIPGEFAYDPKDLEVIQLSKFNKNVPVNL
jgi:hypothetical protein